MKRTVEAPQLNLKKLKEFKPGSEANKAVPQLPEGTKPITGLRTRDRAAEAPAKKAKEGTQQPVAEHVLLEGPRPFGMRPQEVSDTPSDARVRYNKEEQRTNVDLSRPLNEASSAKTEVLTLTKGKIDDVQE